MAGRFHAGGGNGKKFALGLDTGKPRAQRGHPTDAERDLGARIHRAFIGCWVFESTP
jgi:hypothetical protein